MGREANGSRSLSFYLSLPFPLSLLLSLSLSCHVKTCSSSDCIRENALQIPFFRASNFPLFILISLLFFLSLGAKGRTAKSRGSCFIKRYYPSFQLQEASKISNSFFQSKFLKNFHLHFQPGLFGYFRKKMDYEIKTFFAPQHYSSTE